MQEIQSYKNAETNSLENEIYSLDNQKEFFDIDSL